MIAAALVARGDTGTAPPPGDFDERFPLEVVWDLSEDAEGTAFIDALDWIRLHPLDLNRAAADELLAIPGVTPSGAGAILAFRERGGTFRSVEDIRTLPGGGEMLCNALRPFVCVAPRRGGGGVQFRDLVVGHAPAQAGTLGPPVEIVSRVTVEGRGGLEAGATLSRRAGERMEDALLTAYASVPGAGILRRLIAGDFDVEAGEGVALWRGPSTPGAFDPLRSGVPGSVTPHRGADRGHFLRGAAVSLAVPSGPQCALFVSGRSYAATVDTSGDASAFFTGTYSTPASSSKRDALHERLAGFLLECPLGAHAGAGLTLYGSRFDRIFTPSDPDRLSGSATGACGAHAWWSGPDMSLRGEFGVLKGGANAFACTAAFLAPGGEAFALRYCDFPPRFDNPHACTDGALGETRNERICTADVHFSCGPGSGGECRVEAFEHPAPTRECPIPRRGLQLTLVVKSSLRGRGLLTERFSLRRSYECASGADALDRRVPLGGPALEQRNLICAASPAVSGVTLGERCEIVRAVSPGGSAMCGALVGGEIDAALPFGGRLGARLSLFRTEGYDARVYDREEALPGLLSAPPLYGRGVRWYVRLCLRPLPGFSLTCRYAVTAADNAPGDAASPPADNRQLAVQLDAAL